MKILLSTLSEEEIKRGVCIPSGTVEASPGERVTSPMRRIPKPCNWKLINSRESYAMHNESKPPPALTIPLMVKRMPVTDKGQGPHQASLSPTRRSTATNVSIRARHTGAWEMTL